MDLAATADLNAGETLAAAITAWNTRALTPPPQADDVVAIKWLDDYIAGLWDKAPEHYWLSRIRAALAAPGQGWQHLVRQVREDTVHETGVMSSLYAEVDGFETEDDGTFTVVIKTIAPGTLPATPNQGDR